MKYPQIIAAIQNCQWAMTYDAMYGLLKAVESGIDEKDYNLFHGAAIGDIDCVTEDLGFAPLSDPENEYIKIKGSIGTLLIDGPIVPRSRRSWKVSGINSIQQLSANFKKLNEDDEIKNIVLFMDTPGGDITGLSDFAAQVAASTKPVNAYIFGMAASAGYFIASQADTIVSADSGLVGSIGVVSVFRKRSDNLIEIVSRQSPNKRLDPESKNGQEHEQIILSDLADIFVSAVASGRGVSKEKVLSDFGQGDMLVAGRAKRAGMIDKIMTLGDFLSELENGESSIENTNKLFSAQGVPLANNNNPALEAGLTPQEGKMAITLTEAIEANPAIKGEVEKIKADAFDAGVSNEKEAITVRAKKAIQFIGNAEYGNAVTGLAIKVITGEEPTSALTSAVTVLDAQKELNKSNTAVAETEATGEIGSIDPVTAKASAEQLAAKASVDKVKGTL